MAANFFEQQAQARTATKRLVLLYVLAVMSIITAITFAFHLLFLVNSSRAAVKYGSALETVPVGYDLVVALAVLAVIGISTLVRMIQVGSSGENVALMLGGVPVSPSTTDPLERRLMNVVEEMSIASGMPVPRVFVMPDEDGINAFAAGMKPGQAVISVTRGTLEELTRDELQGVIAHEFSHIFNGDMRLNLRLMGVLGGILVIATVGRLLFQVTPSRSSTSSDKKDDGNALIIFGIALFVIGYIGVFFARLIKAAVSRQREYLADASAVQFTRNPEGIGGALMKIRGYAPASKIHSHYADEASHMFFGSALDFSSMFATHPPLEDRIAHIEPSLLKSGTWVAKPAFTEIEAKAAGLPYDESVSASFSGGAKSPEEFLASASAPMGLPVDVTPANTKSVMASIGAPSATDMDAARSFLDSIPASIRERTRDGQGAVLLVVALFIEAHEIQADQLQILSRSLSPEEVQDVVSIRRELSATGELDRLSLLELSIPPLRQLTPESKKMLMKIGTELAHADNELDLYEYVALALLEHQLLRDLRDRKPKPSMSSARTSNDLAILLSAIAYAGADDIPSAKRAFDAGVADLQKSLNIAATLRPLDECSLQQIADSIERLSYLGPDAQQKVIHACVESILVDGVVNTKESELLRGLCAVLEAPLPTLAV
jgi:Zn-dependent protease with chaperone function